MILVGFCTGGLLPLLFSYALLLLYIYVVPRLYVYRLTSHIAVIPLRQTFCLSCIVTVVKVTTFVSVLYNETYACLAMTTKVGGAIASPSI